MTKTEQARYTKRLANLRQLMAELEAFVDTFPPAAEAHYGHLGDSAHWERVLSELMGKEEEP